VDVVAAPASWSLLPGARWTPSMFARAGKPQTKKANYFLERQSRRRRQRPVEPGRTSIRSLQIDGHANAHHKRNALGDSLRCLRPSDPARRRRHRTFSSPRSGNVGDRITLHAKLNYRKFSWFNTQFSFAGIEQSRLFPILRCLTDQDHA